MKIEASPFAHPPEGPDTTGLPSPYGQQVQGDWDENELGFLSLLNALNRSETTVGQSALDLLSPPATAEGDLKARAIEKSTVREQTLKESAMAALNPTAAFDQSSPSEVKKELDAFKTEMTSEDIAYLKTINPNGLPIAPPVPLNQLIPLDDEGKPQFERIPASKGLASLIEKAYKTGRPIRVELDNGGSIILKIKEGKVSAEFIATDQANALYLKQQLAELKQRMEAKNLPVGTLDSRQEEDRPKKRQQQESDSEHSVSREVKAVLFRDKLTP